MYDKLNKLLEEYYKAAHALQSGVAAEMMIDPKPTEPKHLRVGINMAHVDHAALAKLLIDKGIITEEEYYMAILKAVRREVAEYEEKLSKHYGKNVNLR